jgi:DNA-binding XRE family transcriptional regulator
MMKTRISLAAARVNANLTQNQVAKELSSYFGQRVSRQRIAAFEKHPESVPPAYGLALSELYRIPIDDLLFAQESTLSYTLQNRELT